MNTFRLSADNLFGAEITYTHLKVDSIRINLYIYGDCARGDYDDVGQIQVTLPDKKIVDVTPKFSRSKDVTPVRNGCTICDSLKCMDVAYGIKQFLYEATIDLKSYKGCEFGFSWEGYIRTTGGSGNRGLYVEAKMNRCINGYISSPEFVYDKYLMAPKNQCVFQVHAAEGVPGDSLVYSLTSPRRTASLNYVYPSGYSFSKPIAYSKYPNNPSSTYPACDGFNLNANTGELSFMPTKEGISATAIKVEQYFKDTNGVMKKVGEIVRDFTIIITDSNTNLPPKIFSTSLTNNYYICAGDFFNIGIHTLDSDLQDSVYLETHTTIPGSDFVLYNQTPQQSGRFTWMPLKSQVRSQPYHFYVNFYDNHSPYTSYLQRAFNVYVIGQRPSLTIYKTNNGCSSLKISVNGDTNEVISYKWFINNLLVSTNKAFEYTAFRNGKYKLKLVVENKAKCISEYKDSFNITSLPEINLGKDTGICPGTQLILNASGNKNYIYKWEKDVTLPDDTSATYTVMPRTTTHYMVSVRDKNGCEARDTLTVNIDEFAISVTKDTFACKNQKVILRVTSKQKNITYHWSPSAGLDNPSAEAITVYPQATVTYTVTATNKYGCVIKDSVKIKVGEAKAFAGPDTSICNGESVLLKGSGGFSYQWHNKAGQLISTKAEVLVKPTSTEQYFLTVTDSTGCIISRDNLNVYVSELQTTISRDTAICLGDTIILHASGGNIYNWFADNTLIGRDSSSLKVYPAENTIYTVQIKDTTRACADMIRKVTVRVSKDCVWPGDANGDKIVNYLDLLDVAAGFGIKGPPRINAGIAWDKQFSNEWLYKTPGGLNYKHLDCNGDGIINAADTLVIATNYGKSINPQQQPQPVQSPQDPPLYFRFAERVYYGGDTVKVSVILGANNNHMNEAYGIALKYLYDDTYMQPGTYRFNWVCNGFCVENNTLNIYRQSGNTTVAEGAMARTDRARSAEKGIVAQINFVLRDSNFAYPEQGAAIAFNFLHSKVINKAGAPIKVFSKGDSVTVFRVREKEDTSHIGIKPESISSQLKVYPNPASNMVYIDAGEHLLQELYVINMLGESVIFMSNPAVSKASINTSQLPPGIYFLRLKTGNNHTQHKLIIAK